MFYSTDEKARTVRVQKVRFNYKQVENNLEALGFSVKRFKRLANITSIKSKR